MNVSEGKINLKDLRLGGTSWVVPGGFEDNLRELSTNVYDMEIVLFDTPTHSNLPSREEVLRLKDLCDELSMSCTVHFPRDMCVSKGEAHRTDCEDNCLRTMELFAPLEPFAWIMHLIGEKRGNETSADMEKWRELAAVSAARFAKEADDPQKICVETLDYDFAYAEDIVLENGLSICLDIGHTVRYKRSVEDTLQKYLPYTKVFHIHGVMPDGTDHTSMEYFDRDLLRRVLTLCADGTERVMSIEVFEDDYKKSLKVFQSISELNRKDAVKDLTGRASAGGDGSLIF